MRIARELQPAKSPDRRSLDNAPGLLRRVEDFSTSDVRCEISLTGHAKQLKPAVQEQINLIAKEALVNALLHSQGTCVEIEVEYSARRLR